MALAIAGLVALAIFGLFRIGFAFHRRSTQAVAAGEAAIALDAIFRTLRETGREEDLIRGWSNATDGAVYHTVAVRTARGRGEFAVGKDGMLQWLGWIGFAHDPVRQAIMRVDFPEGEEVPSPPWAGGRVVARQVKNFIVQRDADRFIITLLFEGGGESLTLTTTVWPRNR